MIASLAAWHPTAKPRAASIELRSRTTPRYTSAVQSLAISFPGTGSHANHPISLDQLLAAKCVRQGILGSARAATVSPSLGGHGGLGGPAERGTLARPGLWVRAAHGVLVEQEQGHARGDRGAGLRRRQRQGHRQGSGQDPTARY